MMTMAASTLAKQDSNAANGCGDEGEDKNSWSQFHDDAFVDVLEEDDEQGRSPAADAAATAATMEPGHQQQQQQQQHQAMIVDQLPPQLHPAVSAGIRHVSSCYFSVSSEVSSGGSVGANNNNTTSSSRMGSVADLLSLLDEAVQQEQENNHSPYHLFSSSKIISKSDDLFSEEKCIASPVNNSYTTGATNINNYTNRAEPSSDHIFLNHDVLMNVMTFLDAKSLAVFSETARRLNFEVFYFLQLQLQRSLLMADVGSSLNHHSVLEPTAATATTYTAGGVAAAAGSVADLVDATSTSTILQGQERYDQQQQQNNVTDRSLSDIPGVVSLARLAALEPGEAQDLVRLFLDSNSSLSTRHLPLSHSMAYLRQFLLRHTDGAQSQASPTTMASAALLVTLMGAASLMGKASVGSEVLPEFAAACSQASAEMIPHMLKLGFVGGLMGAAKSMSSTEQQPQATSINMRERAQQMASRMQSFLEQLRGAAATTNAQDLDNVDSASNARSLFANTNNIIYPAETATPWTPNPYEHHITSESSTLVMDQPEDHQDRPEPPPPRSACSSSSLPPVKRKTPTGCVGAYWKVVSRASARLTQLVKEKRAAKFRALPRAEQVQLASALIEACGSNASLSVVQDLIQKRACMDVDGFYGGDDNGVAQTCALHTAAFYGACEILEFLCRGIDEQLCHVAQDGGLCNVNLSDGNGYTALHFAVIGGINNNDDDSISNTTRAVFEILVAHGADLQLESSSGYTPLQWAVRLQNHIAAKELRRQLEIQNEKQRQQRLLGGSGGWMHLPSAHNLSAIAKRFFDLVHHQSTERA